MNLKQFFDIIGYKEYNYYFKKGVEFLYHNGDHCIVDSVYHNAPEKLVINFRNMTQHGRTSGMFADRINELKVVDEHGIIMQLFGDYA